MKLLLFSKHFWPENFIINDITKNLQYKDVNIDVISEKSSYLNYDKNKKKNLFFYKKKIKIYRVWSFSRSGNNLSILSNYLSHIISATFFSFFLIKKKYDLVFIYATSPIFQAIPAIIYGKITKTPIIIWVQDLWPDVLFDLKIINNKFILNLINYLTVLIYKNCDKVLVQSKSYKKIISKYISHKKIKVLYNPETQKFLSYKKKKKKIIITYAGNIGKAQGINILVKVAKKTNSNIFFKIYGNGSEKNKLIKEIKENNLEKKIIIYNPVEYSKLKKIFQESSILLILLKKGKALYSTLPAKLQLYMSVSKPLIVSADGELNKFVKDNKIGFVSSSEDVAGLLKSIQEYCFCSEKRLLKMHIKIKSIFLKEFEMNLWIKNFLEYIDAKILKVSLKK